MIPAQARLSSKITDHRAVKPALDCEFRSETGPEHLALACFRRGSNARPLMPEHAPAGPSSKLARKRLPMMLSWTQTRRAGRLRGGKRAWRSCRPARRPVVGAAGAEDEFQLYSPRSIARGRRTRHGRSRRRPCRARLGFGAGRRCGGRRGQRADVCDSRSQGANEVRKNQLPPATSRAPFKNAWLNRNCFGETIALDILDRRAIVDEFHTDHADRSIEAMASGLEPAHMRKRHSETESSRGRTCRWCPHC